MFSRQQKEFGVRGQLGTEAAGNETCSLLTKTNIFSLLRNQPSVPNFNTVLY